MPNAPALPPQVPAPGAAFMNHLRDAPSNALTGATIGTAVGVIAQRFGANCSLEQCMYFGAQATTALAGLRLGLQHPERAYEISMAVVVSAAGILWAGRGALAEEAVVWTGHSPVHTPQSPEISVMNLFPDAPLLVGNNSTSRS